MTSDLTSSQDERAEVTSSPALSAKEADDRLLAEAERYGVDLTLLERNLCLSPTERLENLQSAAEFVQDLRAAMRRVV